MSRRYAIKAAWKWVSALWLAFGCGFNHASHADGALTFLCFAKEK